MSTITLLPPRKPVKTEPCEKCIAFLQGMLDRAIAGDIQQVAVAYVTGTDAAGNGYVHGQDMNLLGSVSVLHHRMNGDAS